MTWKICNSQKYAAAGTAWEIDINTAGTFTLLSSGTVDVDVYWGDGDVETVTTNSVDHTYPAAGIYTIGIVINSGDFRPRYNNDPAAAELVTLGDTPAGWSFGTSLQNAFYGSGNLTAVGDIDTSSVTNFQAAWRNCTSLDNITALGDTYSFPEIDTSSGTNFQEAWRNCTGLTSFPPLDTSLGTNFYRTWYNCTSLTSFPARSGSLMDVSSGVYFYQAWYNCNSMTTFPPNFFDSWTGTPVTNCFNGAWDICSELTGTSVANILDSIDTSGQSGPVSGFDITIDYKVGEDISAVLGAGNAVDNLTGYISDVGKGWTVTLNGTLYEKLNP
jgi:hypothetical protein